MLPANRLTDAIGFFDVFGIVLKRFRFSSLDGFLPPAQNPVNDCLEAEPLTPF